MCCRVKSWNRCFIELRVIFISPGSYSLLLLLLSLIIDGVWPGLYREAMLHAVLMQLINLKFDGVQGTLYIYFVFTYGFLICVRDVPIAFLTFMNWGDLMMFHMCMVFFIHSVPLFLSKSSLFLTVPPFLFALLFPCSSKTPITYPPTHSWKKYYTIVHEGPAWHFELC